MYQIVIARELAAQLMIHHIEVDDFLEFADDQIQEAITKPFNYNKLGEKKPVWIVRGYYPDSSLFYKLSIIQNELIAGGTDIRVFAKSLDMRYKSSKRNNLQFAGEKIIEIKRQKFENVVLGTSHIIEPICLELVRMPKVMAPKGMKLNNLSKPKKTGKL